MNELEMQSVMKTRLSRAQAMSSPQSFSHQLKENASPLHNLLPSTVAAAAAHISYRRQVGGLFKLSSFNFS